MSYQEKMYIERKMGREEGRQEERQAIIEKMRKTGMSEEQIKAILAS